MSDDLSWTAPSRLVAVLGPTNTGKTHLAVERMLAHSSGMIGLPLRLLAREIYDRIVKTRGARSVALVTGEEKITPVAPRYWVCTVEAMPLDREVEFLAVDEIQLCADRERGHVFTDRLLNARGKSETMFMGAATVAPLIRLLCPHAEIQSRERFSQLSYDGPKKLTKLPKRSAVVAFSAEAVYAIGELIRRFLLHTLPDGFHRIRNYGFLANGHRVAKLDLCRRLLATPTPQPVPPVAYTREQYLRLTGRALDICPCCGGLMKNLGAIPPARPSCHDTS